MGVITILFAIYVFYMITTHGIKRYSDQWITDIYYDGDKLILDISVNKSSVTLEELDIFSNYSKTLMAGENCQKLFDHTILHKSKRW